MPADRGRRPGLRWRLLANWTGSLSSADEQDDDRDEIDWRTRKVIVIVVAIAFCAVVLAQQLWFDRYVRDRGLPPQCAVRGQGCPTTTTEGPRAAE